MFVWFNNQLAVSKIHTHLKQIVQRIYYWNSNENIGCVRDGI